MINYNLEWHDIEVRRDIRLAASDWTQLPDSPLSDAKKAEWAVYRQALRDIPSKWPADVNKTTTNPHDTSNIFPVQPS